MPRLDPQEMAIIARAAEAPMREQTIDWALINSGSRNLPGLAAMASTLAEAFAVLPGNIELVEGAPVDAVAADGTRTTLEHGRHLVVRVRPEAPLRMLFTGHMDTVFPADHPFQTVTDLGGDRIGGPGVADMKGGIAVMLAALRALEHADDAGRFGYDVLINSDEEVGSLSSSGLIADLARGKLAAFTYEPSALPDGTLAGARAGSGNFSITIRGRAAHAGRNPQEGRNALVAAADLAVRLAAHRTSDLAINPAKIDGGGPNNVVPDLAILRVNLRPTSADAEQRARQMLADLCYDIALDHDVKAELHGSFARPPKAIDPRTERLFGIVTQAGRDLGLTLNRRDTGGVCDGNNIAACGVPVIDTMGVRGGSIHSDQEYCHLDSLEERASLSILSVMRILKQGGL